MKAVPDRTPQYYSPMGVVKAMLHEGRLISFALPRVTMWPSRLYSQYADSLGNLNLLYRHDMRLTLPGKRSPFVPIVEVKIFRRNPLLNLFSQF